MFNNPVTMPYFLGRGIGVGPLDFYEIRSMFPERGRKEVIKSKGKRMTCSISYPLSWFVFPEDLRTLQITIRTANHPKNAMFYQAYK